MVIRGPIGCTVDFRCRLLHMEIILLKKPSRIALCNKAVPSTGIIYLNHLVCVHLKQFLLSHS
ncbi:hypothetical protein CAP43_15030 [Acinetobacter junii]|nr:hypothetical protein [Acinetobacter junii]